MTFRRLFLVLSVALPASQALATGEIESLITAADRTRLENYDETRKTAIDEARKGGAAEDVATLDAIVARKSIAFTDFDMTGDWRCRTIKAGGPAPLVVYGWFKCRVSDDGSGWTLEKLTGSQRTKGRFFTDSDLRLTYLGSFMSPATPPSLTEAVPKAIRPATPFAAARKNGASNFPRPITNPGSIYWNFAVHRRQNRCFSGKPAPNLPS